jgi:hypothetical protein
VQIVIAQPGGQKEIAYRPPQMMPALDITPAPEAEPAPSGK